MIDANLLEERVLEMMVGQLKDSRAGYLRDQIGSARGWRIRRGVSDVCDFSLATRTDVASSLMLNAQCPGRSIITARTIFTFRPGTPTARVSRAMECGGLAPPCLQRLRWRLNLQPLRVGHLAVRRREHAPALQSRFATRNGRAAQFGVVDMNLQTKASLRQPRGIRFAIESPKPPEGAKDEGQDESINLH